MVSSHSIPSSSAQPLLALHHSFVRFLLAEKPHPLPRLTASTISHLPRLHLQAYTHNSLLVAGCTPKAIIHRIGKIKTIGKTTLTEPDTNGAATTPGSKKRVKNEEVDDAVNGENGEPPTKKPKAPPAKPKTKTRAKAPPAPVQTMKEEDSNEEDETTATSD